METKLHFLRQRAKGDSLFYDPQADIRLRIPELISDLISVYHDKYAGDERRRADVEYLANCFAVFKTRVLEDRSPISGQLDEFSDAVGKIQSGIVDLFMYDLSKACIVLYALLMRRDSGADENYSKSVSRVAVLRWLSDVLSGDTLNAVRRELKERDFPTYRMLRNQWLGADSFSVDAVCLEKPDFCIKDIKEKAIHWLDCSGDSDWNSLSAACDAFFADQNPAAESMEASVSLALAYPNYENPVFTVSVTETDADGKRGTDA